MPQMTYGSNPAPALILACMSIQPASAARLAGRRAVYRPSLYTRFGPLGVVVVAVAIALANAVALVQALNLYHTLALEAPVSARLALRHGGELFALERALHIAVEPAVQHLLARGLRTPLGLLSGAAIRHGLVWIYLHAFPAWLFAALAWSYVYRPAAFVRRRDLTIISALLAVACYWLVPVAPPRFVLHDGPGGVQDWTYGGTSVDPHVIHLVGFNQYAAFPSVHLLAALIPTACLAGRSRSVWVWGGALCFPLVMALTVIGTGNHYVRDCVGSLAILTVSAVLARGVDRVHAAMRRRLRPGRAAPYELPSALSLCLCCAALLALVGKPGGPRLLLAVAILLLVVFATGRSRYLWQGQRRLAPGRQALWRSDYLTGLLFVAGASAATQPVAPLPSIAMRVCACLWLLACMSALVRHVRITPAGDVRRRSHGSVRRYLPSLQRCGGPHG